MSKLSSWLREKNIIGPIYKPPPHTTVGRRTYGISEETVHFASERALLKVGSFCSVARGVIILCHGNHSIDTVSSFPIHGIVKRPQPPDYGSRALGVTIGSDVWIGHGATILSGVTIGHGAVIGAAACVTKDVPPFAIVASIRYRFTPDEISKLLAISWWDWDDEKIKQEADWLAGPIEDFVARHCPVDALRPTLSRQASNLPV